MNYYKGICKLLNIEEDEKFKIKDTYTGTFHNGEFHINKDGIFLNNHRIKKEDDGIILKDLLSQKTSIVKFRR